MSHPDPSAWRDFVSRHSGGGVLDGRVTQVLPFGAFVEVGEGVNGLLPRNRDAAPLEPGAKIAVKIASIDVENQRVSLAPA
jgi:ribosomal protein S1